MKVLLLGSAVFMGLLVAIGGTNSSAETKPSPSPLPVTAVSPKPSPAPKASPSPKADPSAVPEAAVDAADEPKELPVEPEKEAERIAILASSPKNKIRIKGLDWENPDAVELKVEFYGEELKAFAILKGSFKSEDWGLVWEKTPIEIKESQFKLEIPLKGRVTDFEMTSIGPLGEVEPEKFSLMVPDWDKFKKRAAAKPPKRWVFMPGFGTTLITYAETSARNNYSFTETALTVKAAFNFLLFPPWFDVGLNAFMNVQPITTTLPEYPVRFLGANFRFGFAAPFIPEPWRVSLLVGLSYTTMFVPGNIFGYQHLMWPQLYPVIRRVFKKGHTLVAYLKYASLAEGFTLSFVTNRELAAGGSFVIPLKGLPPLSLSFDYSNMNISFRATSLITSSYTLGVGTSF